MNRQLIVIAALWALLLAACQIDLTSTGEAANPNESSVQVTTESVAGSNAAPENGASEEALTSAAHPAQQLIASFTESTQTNGDVLILFGQVLDVNGNPVPDAVVEIWQTDASGVYDHPRDPGTGSRDTSFQFFGMATTDADGWYAFRTLVPGRYEPRPRHIHYKVKQNGTTLLTSQFYFSDDIAEVQGEGMFRAVGESGDLLLLQLVQGDGHLLAHGRMVVDIGIGAGTLPLTPSQGEGPYYPVVDLSTVDNDLVRLP